MPFEVIEQDNEAASWYRAAKTTGENYAMGCGETNLSAFVTRFDTPCEFIRTVHDGFADGMRDARDNALSDIRATLRLIKGKAA